MSNNGEHLLAGDPLLGNQGFGYAGKTNRGWAALPFGRSGLTLLGFRTLNAARAASTSVVLHVRNVLDGTVADLFHNSPVYGHHVDDQMGEKRDWTVTIAGSERHDGEAPYTYVVSAESQQQAWSVALSTHIRREESVDCFIVPAESHEGVPAEDCGYGWNDLRSQAGFWAAIEGFTSMMQRFDKARAPFLTEDGDDIKSECLYDYDKLRGDYEEGLLSEIRDLTDASKHV
jgi:hypothetical protein